MKHTTVSLEEFFFYVYFIIMLGAKGLGLVSGSTAYKACIVIAMFFLALKLAAGKYSFAEYAVIALLLILCIYIWSVTGNQGFFICMSLVVSLKHISVKKVFNIGAFIWTSAFIIQIIRQLLNLRTRDFVIHNKYGLGYIVRWALGYSHPNVLQISYAVMVMLLFYAFRPEGKKLVRSIIISFIGACYIFMYSLSATGMLLYFMFVVFVVIFEFERLHSKERNKGVKVILKLIFPFVIFASVLGPVILKGRAFEIVDRLMTTRLSLSKKFYADYGISLFGKDFSNLQAAITLDCSYTRLLMYGGLVIFILVCVGYVLMINDAVNEKMSNESSIKLAILFSTVIAGISEPFLFNESFKNLTLIFMGEWLFSKALRWSQVRKEYSIIKQRMITIPVFVSSSEIQCSFDRMRNKKRALTVVILLCAVMGTMCYMFSAKLPDEVCALRTSCDTDDNSVSKYLTEEEVEQYDNSGNVWILNYKDSDTQMLFFSGRIIQVEFVRGVVSSFVWSGAAALFVAFLYFYFTNTKHASKKRRGNEIGV